MPAPRLLPTSDVLRNLREQGWALDDIAREYGVTKGAVYLQLRDAGYTKKRPNYKHLIPWTVRKEHAFAHPALMLRTLGRRESGAEVKPVKSRMLDKWLRDLRRDGLVVCYDPDCPPNPASPVHGGWYYSERRPSDGDALIRYEPPRRKQQQ